MATENSQSADPSEYSKAVDATCFRFIIVPTVLAELDGLKRDPRVSGCGGEGRKSNPCDQGLA
jgi:hypothetical protein